LLTEENRHQQETGGSEVGIGWLRRLRPVSYALPTNTESACAARIAPPAALASEGYLEPLRQPRGVSPRILRSQGTCACQRWSATNLLRLCSRVGHQGLEQPVDRGSLEPVAAEVVPAGGMGVGMSEVVLHLRSGTPSLRARVAIDRRINAGPEARPGGCRRPGQPTAAFGTRSAGQAAVRRRWRTAARLRPPGRAAATSGLTVSTSLAGRRIRAWISF
jgi:hypothetical protein